VSKPVPLVLFNASVILAAIKSPSGGSGKIAFWSKQKKIKGLVSEIIFDEALRNAVRINTEPKQISQQIRKMGIEVCIAPTLSSVNKFNSMVAYPGDAHVLASADENNVDFLVTLDKKHLLILQKKISQFKIVSPGELIAILEG